MNTLYQFAAIVRKRGREYYKKQLIPEILHSSLFLSTNAYSYVTFFCLWRYVFGNIYFLTTGFLPAASAALLSICLERKSRRGLLALYVTNLITNPSSAILCKLNASLVGYHRFSHKPPAPCICWKN
eukprot:XP_014776600.1 PREDICTED: transmembrane protein 135-like [Octopus bimaculoides]